MTNKVVVFDTNVLPDLESFRSNFWRTILKICSESGFAVSIPEIVLHESVNLRRERYEAAVRDVTSGSKKLGKYWSGLDIYVPDSSEIASKWESTLNETFTVLSLHGDDAIEALKREADRRRPAREGNGGRDATIWLTVLRLATKGSMILFVSENIKDFGDGSSGLLHPDLRGESEKCLGEVIYLRTLNDLIDRLAAKISVPSLDNRLIQEKLSSQVSHESSNLLDDLSISLEDQEYLLNTGAEIKSWEIMKSYELESKGLVMVRGEADLKAGGTPHPVAFTGWVNYDLGDLKITSVNVESVYLLTD